MRKIEVFIAGVYRIKCIANGFQYYGQSGSVLLRFSSHITQLNAGKHINKQLQHDWVQHGALAFEFCLIQRIDCSRERCKLESSMISNPRWRGKLYNNTVIKKIRKPNKSKIRMVVTKPLLRAERYKEIFMRRVDAIPYADIPKLLTLSECAKKLGMSINTFKYHALKADAPVAIGIGKQPKPFWYEADIAAWKPRTETSASFRKRTGNYRVQKIGSGQICKTQEGKGA